MSLSQKLLDLKVDLEKAIEISNKLSQQDIYMSTFFHLSNDLLTIANSDGYFRIVNQTWSDVLGYSSKELTSQKWLDFVHPDDIPKTIEAAQQLFVGPIQDFVNRYRTKDGKYISLSWNCKQTQGGTIYACAKVV